MTTIERIKELCNEKKISISRLERDCGFSNGYIRKLIKGNLPTDRLERVASYLNVDIKYLVSGEKPIDYNLLNLAYDAAEYQEFIRLYNQLLSTERESTKAYMSFLLQERFRKEKEKNTSTMEVS